MKIFHWIYTAWFMLWFAIGMVIVYPLFVLGIEVKGLKKVAHFGNIFWTQIFYTFSFVSHRIKREVPTYPEPAVYCANHTSYLDIPSVFLIIRKYFKIIGKAELNSVPLFGYMFRNLYISVKRSGVKSLVETLQRAEEAIDQGFNVGFFPEGTIPKKVDPPNMISFKDGPFRVAIKKQVPIIPVTLPYNFKFLHDADLPLRWHPMKAIVHAPIETTGMTMEDVQKLKEQTRTVIHEELKRHHPGLE